MARGPIPDLPADRPKAPDVADLIRQLYATPEGGVGCCLHIVVDDDNIERHFIELCAEDAHAAGHVLCERIARALAQMTPTQVRRAVRLAQVGRG